MKLIYEIIGYLGTSLVVLSMAMSSVVRLRAMNILGSVLSGLYSALIGAYPIVIMNLALIFINLYRLIKDGKGQSEGETQ